MSSVFLRNNEVHYSVPSSYLIHRETQHFVKPVSISTQTKMKDAVRARKTVREPSAKRKSLSLPPEAIAELQEAQGIVGSGASAPVEYTSSQPILSRTEPDDFPDFEDQFYAEKKLFSRHFKKEDKSSWSRTAANVLRDRKIKRDEQRKTELQRKEQIGELQRKELEKLDEIKQSKSSA
jgi:hypothetical protein